MVFDLEYAAKFYLCYNPFMLYVYILETADGRFYTGITNDVNRRMTQHKEGKGAKFTRAFKFKQLLYSESHPSKSQALKREKQIQQLTRREKFVLMNKSSAKPL